MDIGTAVLNRSDSFKDPAKSIQSYECDLFYCVTVEKRHSDPKGRLIICPNTIQQALIRRCVKTRPQMR